MRALAVAVLLAPLILFGSFVAGLGLATTTTQSTVPPGPSATGASTPVYTVATLNILGASHTDGRQGRGLGGGENGGWPGWSSRLPRALAKLTQAGVGIAGLQEVHAPQSRALASTYRAVWGMFPRDQGVADKVVWDRTRWRLTERRLVKVPYLYGHLIDTPLVQLTSIETGQAVWVWSIHNPIGARKHRLGALRRQLHTLTQLATTGVPVILVGDFNDASDGRHRSEAALAPSMLEAPTPGSSIDHIYGTHLLWQKASVDRSTQTQRVSDHPLVTATWLPVAPTAASGILAGAVG